MVSHLVLRLSRKVKSCIPHASPLQSILITVIVALLTMTVLSTTKAVQCKSNWQILFHWVLSWLAKFFFRAQAYIFPTKSLLFSSFRASYLRQLCCCISWHFCICMCTSVKMSFSGLISSSGRLILKSLVLAEFVASERNLLSVSVLSTLEYLPHEHNCVTALEYDCCMA